MRKSLHTIPIVVINEFAGPTRIFPSSFKGQLILESATGDYFKSTSAGKEAEWEPVSFAPDSGGVIQVQEDPEHVGFAELSFA
jgi:ABC-type phosphate transport system substrate-binding protein